MLHVAKLAHENHRRTKNIKKISTDHDRSEIWIEKAIIIVGQSYTRSDVERRKKLLIQMAKL